MEKILVLAYPGSGKTELERQYEDVVDFEHQDFRYVYDESIRHLPLELRKGSTDLRKDNPEWPENFLTNALSELDEGKIVVSPFVRTVYEAYNSDYFKDKAKDVKTILVCPRLDQFEDYIERFKERGNSDNFIARRKSEIAAVIEIFENAENCQKIVLESGQYLAESLKNYGIKLNKKKIYTK